MGNCAEHSSAQLQNDERSKTRVIILKTPRGIVVVNSYNYGNYVKKLSQK